MEIWKDIPGIDGVEASSLGRIRRILKITNTNNGYGIVTITDGKSISKQYKVHRLVASAFLGLDLNDKESIIMHLDDNGNNNNIENLKIGTIAENVADMVQKGRCRGGEKLTEFQVVEIRKKRIEGHSTKFLAKTYGVHISTICRICSGVTW